MLGVVLNNINISQDSYYYYYSGYYHDYYYRSEEQEPVVKEGAESGGKDKLDIKQKY